MEITPLAVKNYRTLFNQSPFEEWLISLSDIEARTKVMARLDRVRIGNLGDYRSVGMGVFVLRIHCGPGYRIYFGRHGNALIILLAGGDKSTQERDIWKAKSYWTDYWRRANEAI